MSLTISVTLIFINFLGGTSMDGEDEDGMGLDENGETLRRGDTMDATTPATGPTLVEQVNI